MLEGKKILLGVTGSIAAYKAAALVRLLKKAGCDVKIVMTEMSTKFITPLTLSTLSGHEVHTSWTVGNTWVNHVDLGLWADALLIAPCTAATLSKMASGHADNLLLACYLSAKCPVLVAPAMDLDMWKHPSTKNNLAHLTSYGNAIIPVGNGFLASGLEGEGRMAEPEMILQYLDGYFHKTTDLADRKILITAGPTYEAIDPVRFIGNHSSGKMGKALALECANRGAKVDLVLGPTNISVEHPNIKVIRVQSAEQMYLASIQSFENVDIAILSAAVADYRPSNVSAIKIKKTDDDMKIDLVRTTDIAASLGAIKSQNQILIGFALETNDGILHAKQKLHKKNLDFIVLNSLTDEGAGFKHDTNKIAILDKDGNHNEFSLKPKSEVAKDIIDYLISKYIQKNDQIN